MFDFDFCTGLEEMLSPPLKFQSEFGQDLTKAELAKLDALKLSYGRHSIWSEPVPKNQPPDSHFGCCFDIDGMICVEIDVASYGDVLHIIGLSYGQPKGSRGGWMGSCIPKKNLHYAIGLLPKPPESGGLFPEFA